MSTPENTPESAPGTIPIVPIGAIDVSKSELIAAASARIFLGHQSVGGNLLAAVPGVYAQRGVPQPLIGDPGGLTTHRDGYLAHAGVGANQRPLLKLRDFAERVRGGIGAQVDVAMLKLCYVDVATGTDLVELFTAYQDTYTELAQEFPRVRFVAVTVPLTTIPTGKQLLKARVATLMGRPNRYGPADNLARERLNELIRGAYPDHRRFDLAGVESTIPGGARVSGRCDDAEYFALYRGYAADRGHLNQRGAQTAAAAWLAAVARAVAK